MRRPWSAGYCEVCHRLVNLPTDCVRLYDGFDRPDGVVHQGCVGREGMQVRESVVFFAKEMEKVLSAHDEDLGPEGWLTSDYEDLFLRLAKAVVGLGDACKEDFSPEVIKEAADVGNLSMMFADLARRKG